MKDKKNLFSIFIFIFIIIITYLLIPPEFTVKYKKLNVFNRIEREAIKQNSEIEILKSGKNIFGILNEKKKKRKLKPPTTIKIKTVKTKPVKVVEKIKQNYKLKLLGYLLEDSNRSEVFIHDGKNFHFVKKGDFFLKKYKVEEIRTKSVVLKNMLNNRFEEVGTN